MKSKKPAEKIEYLNLALSTIRNINRLLVKEKNRNSLLKGICNILIEKQSYDKVWLIVLDDSNNLDAYAESGLGSDFIPLLERLNSGKLVNCVQKALNQTSPVLIKNRSSSCGDCPLSLKCDSWGVITVRLMYGEKTYGFLSVSIPKELIAYDIEQAFVEEIAEDISFGLYRIKQEKVHKKVDAALKKRVKELNYFFEFSRLIEKNNFSLEKILQNAIILMPSAMQFPEIICVQIIMENQKFQTDNYKETPWKFTNDIVSHGEKVGILNVCYLEKKDSTDTKFFLMEEENLISSIAARIGKIIERKRSRKALEKSEERLKNLVENSLTCLSIIQNNHIVYQNPEHMKLFGMTQKEFIPLDYNNVHPDDVEHVQEAITKFISVKSSKVDTEFRFFPPGKRKTRIEMKWIYCRLSSIQYQGKEAILVNLMDISHAKELKQLLRIQDKMTSLGRVAAGIAHEIRNPLSGINIYLKAIEKICAKDENQEKINKILSKLQSASNKIESVIKRVMDFSKPGEPKFLLTDINTPVDEAFNLSIVTLKKSGIRVNLDLAPNLPECSAAPHLIEQVVLNLITNASEAMQSINTDKIIEILTFSEKNYVCIKVSDSGPGIPEHIMGSIFDPFYTTKTHSSGIGLSISHRIVTDHNGFLNVSTSKFGGADFIVKIPITPVS